MLKLQKQTWNSFFS